MHGYKILIDQSFPRYFGLIVAVSCTTSRRPNTSGRRCTIGGTLNSFASQTETFKSFICISANVFIDFVWQIALLVLFPLSGRRGARFSFTVSYPHPRMYVFAREGNPLIIQIYLSLPIISATAESMATSGVFHKSRDSRVHRRDAKNWSAPGKPVLSFDACCFALARARHANRIDPSTLNPLMNFSGSFYAGYLGFSRSIRYIRRTCTVELYPSIDRRETSRPVSLLPLRIAGAIASTVFCEIRSMQWSN